MPYVWRLEHQADGLGIYRADSGADDAVFDTIGDHGCDPMAPPGPWSDPGLRDWWRPLRCTEAKQWHFGFATLRQYRNWFHSRQARRVLASFNGSKSGPVVLRKYRVPPSDYRRGEWQAVFRRDCAELLETLTDLEG